MRTEQRRRGALIINQCVQLERVLGAPLRNTRKVS